MLLSRGSFGTFVSRPISGSLLGLLAIFIVWQVVSFFRAARKARLSGELLTASTHSVESAT
jgi:TctA family transporter